MADEKPDPNFNVVSAALRLVVPDIDILRTHADFIFLGFGNLFDLRRARDVLAGYKLDWHPKNPRARCRLWVAAHQFALASLPTNIVTWSHTERNHETV